MNKIILILLISTILGADTTKYKIYSKLETGNIINSLNGVTLSLNGELKVTKTMEITSKAYISKENKGIDITVKIGKISY